MGITFTKDEKKYFEFLIDMGFSLKSSEKQSFRYSRDYDGSFQTISISKDGFTGSWMGKQISNYKLDMIIRTNSADPLEFEVPQQFDHYKTDEEKMVIFDKYKKIIVDTFEEFEKHDHITGNMNEYIYNNYETIVKSINFVPKTIDELNEYAIKLRDEGKTSFKDYIYIIASLMIVFLINNTCINNLSCGLGGYDISKRLNVFLNPRPIEPNISVAPSIESKKLWDKRIKDLFHENREYLDNYFKQKGIKGI